MKKISKAILVGTGIAAVGLLVYSLRKDTEKPVSVWSSDAKPATSPSKEYVEHRRQQIRDTAEAKRAAQQETAMSSPEKEIPQDGEPLHETGEKPEESSTTIAEQNAVPAEPTPLVQAEEQQKEI